MKSAKKLLGLGLIAMLLCCSLLIPSHAEQPAKLQFNQDGTFKIIQVTDLQETFITSPIVKDFLYDIAEAERPDLFVLTGDNIISLLLSWMSPATCRYWVKTSIDAYMDVFDRIYRDFGIPVTMVYGNHDCDAPNTSRAEQFAIYQSHESFIGYISGADTGAADDEQGELLGTHNLLINDSRGTAPVFNLWLFDSGSHALSGGYGYVQKPQIDWFNKTNEALGKLPSLAFQHIVVPEIYDFLTPDKKLPEGTVGQLNEDPCPGHKNDGEYAALCDAGNVMAMFFGHDHSNTYEVVRPGTDTNLINTPCAGFGSTGKHELRGARVINLREDNLSSYETHLLSYKDFYAGNALRGVRLRMYSILHTPGAVVDVLVFKPLLWLANLPA